MIDSKTKIKEDVIRILKNNNWNFGPDDKDPDKFWTSFKTENGLLDIAAGFYHLDKNILEFYAIPPIEIPPKYKNEIGKLSNTINQKLAIGFFALDYENGILYCCSKIYFKKIKLSEQVIINTVSPCLFLSKKYYPAFQAVLKGNSIEDALKLIN